MTIPAATSSFAASLKEKTADLHVAAERHALQQRLVRGDVGPAELARYLGEMFHVHAALEDALRVSTNPAIRRLYRDYHQRAHLYRQDIAALESRVADEPATPAARRFVASIAECGSTDPIALVGTFYVLEGATNGNVYIARALEKSLGLPRGAATSSLDPHGAEQRARWMEFRSELDRLDLTADETARAIEAARATFRAVHDISEDLTGAAATA